MDTQSFIKKAKQIHSNKYDYSKTEYVNTNAKVCIICPIHGEFLQTPHNHLKNHGCKKCSVEINKNIKKLSTEQFIERAKQIHGDKYDYSKVEYVNAQTKVCIICPEHGEFWQTPNSHLSGHGCPKEASIKTWDKRGRITTEQFIERVKQIHGDKYDYSKVEYVNAQTKVCIICPEHGEFWVKPYNLLNFRGCYKCGRNKSSKKQSLSTEQFIERAKQIHGDKYDYSKVEYVNNRTKICIIHPKYGEFMQLPSTHLKGADHPKESNKKTWDKRGRITTEQFIERAKQIHGDKYDYSKVEYKKSNEKVCIICPKHGEFWQTPDNHISSKGCKLCGKERSIKKQSSNTENFIKSAKKIHGDKYDYSKTEYVSAKQKLCIICPEHGEFWQKADNHLHGDGCPSCNNSKLETEIKIMLDEQGIKYNYRERKIQWLNGLELDFYLPDYNIAIECQGIQHFKPIDIFGGKEKFKYRTKNDKRKRELCEENGVKLLYYSNLGIEYPYSVFENKEELLKKIKK